MQKIIAFDIGGTKIAMAVINIGKDGYYFIDSDSASNPVDPDKIERLLLNYCERSEKNFETKRVAIAAAKIVDQEKKKILQAQEVYGSAEFDFGFLKKAGFEVKMENDGRCFALGEYHFGQGKDSKSLLAITYGTDMGGGFLIKDQSYPGTHYSSMEISHMKFLDGDQARAWRDLAGGRAVQNQYNQKTGVNKTAEELFILAEKGDKDAVEIIEKAGKIFGIGLSNLVTVLDPQTIIIGGGVAAQKVYLDNIFKIAKENIFNKSADYNWKISELKEKANLLGAASLYF